MTQSDGWQYYRELQYIVYNMGNIFKKQQNPHRTIYFQRENNLGLVDNKIQTTKYTWYSFLPKAILLQFIRPANLVYLISAILQSIKVISSLNPVTAIAPFVFVIGISLIREGYQDYKRYKKDKEINQRSTHRLVNGEYALIKWEQIHVGDIIKVKNNQTIPADFLLLHSSQQNSICYVQTANLDGQSNLKSKFSLNVDFPQNNGSQIQLMQKSPKKSDIKQYQKLKGKIVVDLPNSNLHQFIGLITMEGQLEKSIDFDNFMLRQTVLKNTQYVVGVVVYAGYDTKIAQNQGHVENKVSQVQRKVNIIQGVLLIVLILLSASCSIGFNYYHNVQNKRQKLTHLKPQVSDYSLEVALIYFSSFLLLTFLIPISLNVSIQVIKGFLGIFLSFDKKMMRYYKKQQPQQQQKDRAQGNSSKQPQKIEKGCSVNNVSILQQLGRIDYILSDKTGTLTANQMVFKHLSVAGKRYSADQIKNQLQNLKKEPDFQKFWIGLVICHDVVCQPTTKQYQGSSPDQVCFLTYAKKINYQFVSRTKNLIQLSIFGQKLTYQLLGILPFDNRKRMSVVVRDMKTKKVYIYTKGADSCILQKSLPSDYAQNYKNDINHFAKQGYRTLLFSYRQIPLQIFEKLQKQKYNIKVAKTKKSQTKQQIQARENKLVEEFQSQLRLIGATAIQDRLQDHVPETIERMEAAGIVVMMITGDKLETAQNIGYLANFIKQDSQVFKIRAGMSQQQIKNIVQTVISTKMQNNTEPVSLLIQGSSISLYIHNTHPSFAQALRVSSSVIFCRSSPKQKSQIVKYVKQHLNGIVLAVGDGGNDVGMIQVAHVGVGIAGKQGNSASNASDFAIGGFGDLNRLILHHGRWFYYRLAYFFVFYGWKNLIMTLLLYFYIIDSAFSAATGLSQPFITIYNIIIGLVLVVYFSVFQQDINDDQYKPAYQKLPTFYKQTKKRDLFSFTRYLLWTFTAIVIALFLYLSTKYSIGSIVSISAEGRPGTFSHHCSVLAISLSIIVIMVLISDIKMYTYFSAILIIGIITIIGTICFFLIENFAQIGTGTCYMILAKSTFRCWLVIWANVGLVYAGKLAIDAGYRQIYGQSQIQKAIWQKKNSQKVKDKNNTLTNKKVHSIQSFTSSINPSNNMMSNGIQNKNINKYEIKLQN